MKIKYLLFLLLATSAYAGNQINVIKADSAKFNSSVELAMTSSEEGGRKIHVTIDSDGGLYNRVNEATKVIKNKNGTIVGFTVREGLGIYGMCMVALKNDGTYSIVPNLEEVVGKQVKQVDVSLDPKSLVLDEINGDNLRFRYTGEEVSPNYFDVYACVIDGVVKVDIKRLKQSMPQEGKK